jgi:magnesium-transporting ATPase (P-type)
MRPLGLVALSDRLRPEAEATLRSFREAGVAVKIISGDDPETVAALARQAGLGPELPLLAGPDLDHLDGPALAQAATDTVVFGRITPAQKERLVDALRAGGHYVAMIGDGVNDVPALKASRLGIAQGSGSQMARSVADLVLVQNDFGSVPDMVVEGRKVLRNLTRVTKLFVTKSAFAVFLVVSIGLTPIAYPLLPRHLSLVAGLAIGIPSFFLALAPSAGDFRIRGFLRDIARFAVPAGTAAGLGVLSSYLAVHEVLGKHLKESRTVAATVLLIVGLYLILALESTTTRRGAWVGALCGVLAGLYVVVLLLPFGRHFYALAVPGPLSWLAIVSGSVIAIGGLVLTDNRFIPGWALHRWGTALSDP